MSGDLQEKLLNDGSTSTAITSSLSDDVEGDTPSASAASESATSARSSKAPENFNLKNGFAELGICLRDGMCEGLCSYFHEELGKPDSRHTVVNGNRVMLIVHPTTNKDVRIVDFIAWVKRCCTSKRR